MNFKITTGQQASIGLTWFRQVRMSGLYALLIAVAACNSEPAKQGESGTEEKQDSGQDEKIAKVQKVFYSVPSPVQAASLLKKAGAQYSKEILNPASNVSKYTTGIAKAVNLGVYGTDLAYTNMFNQTQEAITYLNAVHKLANELGMGGATQNAEVSVRFQNNLGNQDSLIAIISDIFRESDDYLKENQQYNSATLVLVGGWVEGLYIATKQAKKNPSPEITTRIAEQKFSLGNLLALLSDYQAEDADLIKDLTDIKKSYDALSTERTEKASTTDSATKVTSINTVTKVVMTTGQLTEISGKIDALRTKLTK